MERQNSFYQIPSQTDVLAHNINFPICLQEMDSNGRLKKIQAMEMRCFCMIPHISYKYYITYGEVHSRIEAAISPFVDLLTTVKKHKLKWYGHISHSTSLAKSILQGIVPGRRGGSRQRKRWEDNIKEWTALAFSRFQNAAMDQVWCMN